MKAKPYDREALAKRTRSAVAEVVQKQIDCGVDIVNDGELGKSNFSRYTRERLSGFVERPAAPDFRPTSIFGRDMIEFSEYFNRGGRTSIGHHARVFYCAEPLKYVGHDRGQSGHRQLESRAPRQAESKRRFMPAVAPVTSSTGSANRILHERTRRTCSRSPTPCARSTKQSWTPASSSRSTTRPPPEASADAPGHERPDTGSSPRFASRR